MAASDKSLALASFSSRGRIDDNWDRAHVQATNTGLYRPTVTAPGVAINAAKSAAATLMAPGVDPRRTRSTPPPTAPRWPRLTWPAPWRSCSTHARH